MRTVPADLAARYEAAGYWTRNTFGDLLARGITAAPDGGGAADAPRRAGPALDAIKAHLERAGLARQKWPEEVHAVDEFPRTASGKVQKFVLRQSLARKG